MRCVTLPSLKPSGSIAASLDLVFRRNARIGQSTKREIWADEHETRDLGKAEKARFDIVQK
jgi:hypothetical protein